MFVCRTFDTYPYGSLDQSRVTCKSPSHLNLEWRCSIMPCLSSIVTHYLFNRTLPHFIQVKMQCYIQTSTTNSVNHSISIQAWISSRPAKTTRPPATAATKLIQMCTGSMPLADTGTPDTCFMLTPVVAHSPRSRSDQDGLLPGDDGNPRLAWC